MRKFFWGAFLVVCLASTGMVAQVTSRVTGLVQDKTGAVVPNATVTLTNEATNVSLVTKTTSAGTYTFDGIQPGTYRVTVEMSGFKKYVASGNVLDVGKPVKVDASLEVGTAGESVEVHDAGNRVETSTSGNFGNVIDEVSLTTLPIVGTRGRNVLNLIDIQPGVNVGANTGGGVHINGARDRAFNYTLDGIDINETSAGGSDFSPLRTNPDSISEFQILTGNFTAEYGRNPGAEVLMVTRSGTNDLHGTAFYFYQTPGLTANTYGNKITRPDPLPRPQYVQHIGGGSLGGPIRKNKTFFFVNIQALRANVGRVQHARTYTATARQGIFRYVQGGKNGPGVVDSNGNPNAGVTIASYNIGTNDPQAIGLDPTVMKLINSMPLPNDFGYGGDGLNYAYYSWLPRERETQMDYTFKVDNTFNERNQLSVRWAHGHQNTIADTVNGGLPVFPGFQNVVDTYRRPRNLAVNWRWEPTNQTTNEFVIGFNKFGFDFANPDPNFAKEPPFVFNLVDNPLQNYVGNARFLTTLQLVDNFTWVRGAHTFKFGTNLRYQRHIDRRGSIGGIDASQAVDFSTSVNTVNSAAFNLPSSGINSTDLSNLRSAINDMLGRVGTVDQGYVAASDTAFAPPGTILHVDFRMPEYDFYGQDSWRIRPNLVVDLGLRWEIRLSPRETGNRYILHPDQPIVWGAKPTDTINFVHGKLYQDDWNNFGPSIGVAWDPWKDGRTSVRANYRIAYDRINTFSLSSGIFQGMPGLTYQAFDTSFGQSGGRVSQGIPTAAPPAGVTPAALRQLPAFGTGGITVVDPHWQSPYTNMWELGIQRDLGHNTIFEISYLGRHGVHLFGGYDANQVNILNNGFLDAFKIVQAGGDSPLMDQLLAADPSVVKAGQTGSQWVRSNFSTTLARNGVGDLAYSLGRRLSADKVTPSIVAAGFSPFFFFQDPQFSGGMNVLETNDWSNYNALQTQISRRFSSGISFQASYTWSHSLDSRSFDPAFSRVSRGAAQSASSSPFDLNNRRLNYASSDFDRRHVFQANWVAELPFGKKHRWATNLSPALDRLIGGWELSGIMTLESGRPFTVYSGAGTLSQVNNSPADCSACSPSMGNVHQEGAAGVGYQWYFTPEQRANFTQPAAGTIGNTGRNAFRIAPFFNMDLAVGKKIAITERQQLEIRMDMQNALNHNSWDFPNSATITSSVFSRMYGAIGNGNRRMQLVAKYSF